MEKYTAINLGPIIKTFSMARKPKEFWTASYMFSYLMECILAHLQKEKESLELISPYYISKGALRIGVGLYPDRAFYAVKQEIDINRLLDEALVFFACKINLDVNVARNFFRIMIVCQEYSSSSEAIAGLNKALDVLELNQVAWDSNTFDAVLNYLRKANTNLPLFEIAFNKDYYSIGTLEEIARANAKQIDYSYQRYVCIVQADGDCMGKIVSSKQMDGNLNDFSSRLIAFGEAACQRIKAFGGLPIYAGGDDLLFIAPVCGTGDKNILELIGEIDREYREIQSYVNQLRVEVETKAGEETQTVPAQTSMSYGISIIYYKYPLYEAWEIARNMLFSKAKQVSGKNAIAINLRKNSGSDFEVVMSKSLQIHYNLDDLIRFTPKESFVSAVAHKIRANEQLLGVLPKEEPFKDLDERLNAFYEKIVDVAAKSEDETTYLLKTKDTFEFIYKDYFIGKKRKAEEAKENKEGYRETTIEEDMKSIISTFFSVLRIAKFIKGEEVKDE
ncbi:type III-B CRISPR-associated protein Cas10/Cmr2 [Barnesiella viscericola]|uniref:Cas10/Cmr2 second palm domain-containing protein n=1 Tax=Barnesiella viscericola TaxID=397865 RepID=UPI0025A32605|nr:type III-B CRISPR-associated protein Cas10/Cmr2 [Barnesiella viscericola]MDM8269887.1 type III-B CRISPR-associated protein Cas10/Cmr2 [Barnesiella viscericola]